jgi:hypothetical protein
MSSCRGEHREKSSRQNEVPRTTATKEAQVLYEPIINSPDHPITRSSDLQILDVLAFMVARGFG